MISLHFQSGNREKFYRGRKAQGGMTRGFVLYFHLLTFAGGFVLSIHPLVSAWGRPHPCGLVFIRGNDNDGTTVPPCG